MSERDPQDGVSDGAARLSAAFDRGAPRYDLLVAMNPGYHRHLRSAARQLRARVGCQRAPRLLDLACGSGASTRALLSAGGPVREILGVDASPGMLRQARAKRWPVNVRFEPGEAGALDLGRLTASGAWDGIFAAYLFRNVAESRRDAALREAFDLLAPGGWLVAQEYSIAGRPRAAAVWDAVCWCVVIPLGAAIGGGAGLYRYLWRSVRRFDSTSRFADRLAEAGFTDVSARTARGWQRGILHTFAARKPGAA